MPPANDSQRTNATKSLVSLFVFITSSNEAMLRDLADL
jgi:hypothetical protein